MDIDTQVGEGTAPAPVAGALAGGLSTRPYLDSTAQMGNANAANWQEEVYEKIKCMRDMCLSELNELYQKIASMVQQRPQHEQIEKLKIFKMMLEHIVLFLWLNKHEIQPIHKEKLLSVEKHISFFLSSSRPRGPASSPLQGQLPQSSMHTSQWRETRRGEGDATVPMEFEPYTSTVEAPFDSTTQTGNADVDWQEEVYQKIKCMRDMYLSELNKLYQRIASMVQQRPQHEQIEKLKIFKMMLEHIVLFLWLNKHEIQPIHKEKLLSVEKHISFFLSSSRPRGPASSPLQGQLPQSSMHTSQAQNAYARQTPMMGSGQQDLASEFDRLLSLID
ncbi:hypothetical protein RND71_010807 [Anisodus tanguticus]|uniref:Uncharacterized protein n=1 Tax=Anisodus tanguticus TaxID=243964 RepID=A0AAE1VJG0_9SOLA|nr:hypothetical protein RND71_010807 [Anisodus tanguticus]